MVLDLDDLIEKEKLHQNEAQEKYEILKERLRTVEGINIPGGVDAVELSLVHGLVIPHKFKTLVFNKYDSTKCPKHISRCTIEKYQHTRIMIRS